MNDAANLFADRAVQRDAPRRGLLRAAHDGVMRRELRRQMRRREAAGRLIGFAPIERSPEVGATGAARDARVPHGARDYTSRASSRYRQNAFASRICAGVRQSGSNSFGLPTRMQSALAREVATLSRFAL